MAPKAKEPKASKAKAGAKAKLATKRLATSLDAPIAVAGAASDAALALTRALTDPEWKKALQSEFAKEYFQKIAEFVQAERAAHLVHPPANRVFEALNVTPLSQVKVVILGQDPYHEPDQAHGLCFSVLPGVTPPPSLKNMYKELVVDIKGFKAPDHGYLLQWAQRGVLLLNATLTVRGGHTEANSHSKCGWLQFTDEVIRVINEHREGVVFLLWGGFAQKKGKIVDLKKHKVLNCAHPSPLSFKKWQGCKTFSKCNEALRLLGKTEIDWRLDAEVAEDPTAKPPTKRQRTLDNMFNGLTK